MKYGDLKLKTSKSAKRSGRGIAAGRGKTAGRGTKGQGSRKSGGVRPGFEGGQMPLYMRIPKLRGFTSHRIKPVEITTRDLETLAKAKVDTKVLAESGLIEHPYLKVKVIVDGKLTKKMEVNLQSASATAQAMIKKAGGNFTLTQQLKRPTTSLKKAKK